MRKGDWIETYTGRKFWPLDPRPEDICIKDIAHGLSHMCRYNGQSKFFFSVAQHSLNCAEHAKRMKLPQRYQLLCLLHDAAEAYVSDVAKPLKPYLPQFKNIENNIMTTVYEALNVRPPNSIEGNTISKIDTIMLVTEAKVLMTFDSWGDWLTDISPDDETVICERPITDIKHLFVNQLEMLLR
ncbi:phosphohydrolase [Candidatus Contubernalis alkaliaceticus]|uniref:phosphohydrolase n=1 Tax=Candidatus Contubernalis alkaliaceticus TaxID=338645 RepID=UPI001F4C0E73|nr:phosphohydrolase [Candidatus Contubernalis alkalaceticus]UNC91664.1 phosphohydrolase [Candidatus Contubernalis alkalaceticus]